MIYQNDNRLSPRMQKWGCFIRSCMLVAELKTGKELNANLINDIEKFAIEYGYVDDGQYRVIQSAPIIKMAFEYLGVRRKVTEIGTSIGGREVFYPSVSAPFNIVHARIGKYSQSGPSKTLFVVNQSGEIIDPHSPEIRLGKEIYTILYNII